MTTSQLECFISLAGTLNYMKTAEQLGLTQPAVSKQIQSLEKPLSFTSGFVHIELRNKDLY